MTNPKYKAAPALRDEQTDGAVGWFWRTSEGKRILDARREQSRDYEPRDILDDPEIGWQREED